MLVDAPATSVEPEIVDDGNGREGERAVALAERDEHAIIAEADDVDAADAADIGEEARMAVDSPAACVEPEIADDRHRREVERAVAPAKRNEHAVVPKSDDVRKSIAVDVENEARVAVDPPALVETEVRHN